MKKFLIIFISSLLFVFTISISSTTNSLLFGSMSFFVLTLYLVYKKENSYIPFFTILILNFFTVTIGILIKGIDKTNFYGIINFLFLALCCLFAIFLMKIFKQTYKFLFLFLIILISIIYIQCVPKFIENNLYFGTFTGMQDTALSQKNIVAVSYLNGNFEKKINLNNNKKTIVIDFWNNNCGVCFQKFPYFEELKNKYKNHKDIDFYAVNVYKSFIEVKEGDILFNKKKYKFKTLYISEQDAKNFNIKGFPTTVVIKNNKIIFKGNLEVLNMMKKTIIQ